jgi:hypothetical protein
MIQGSHLRGSRVDGWLAGPAVEAEERVPAPPLSLVLGCAGGVPEVFLWRRGPL